MIQSTQLSLYHKKVYFYHFLRVSTLVHYEAKIIQYITGRYMDIL